MSGHEGGRAGLVARWRKRYWDRVQNAKTDLDRVGAAFDHLRIAVQKCAGPKERKAIVEAVIADLVGPAEELLTHFEAHGRKAS